MLMSVKRKLEKQCYFQTRHLVSHVNYMFNSSYFCFMKNFLLFINFFQQLYETWHIQWGQIAIRYPGNCVSLPNITSNLVEKLFWQTTVKHLLKLVILPDHISGENLSYSCAEILQIS
ncbi:hypothetical protein ILYODFUR_033775 [Ilyodon furcidens]|uniref:Uncharacterized protein n=1 Tax=Ilyodon furcidens TaxID=33524 RepID=A0ABV0UYI1_9TELE